MPFVGLWKFYFCVLCVLSNEGVKFVKIFCVFFVFLLFFLFCKCEDFSNIKTVLHSWDKLHLFNHILTILMNFKFN